MKWVFLVGISSIFVFSCTKQQEPEKKIFNQLDKEKTGISFSNVLVENDSLNYFSYAYLYMGGGVSAGDINNDGLADLFFTGNMVSNKLYLNKGNLQFEDITDKAGISGDSRWYTGVTMADINNDGFLDIYCSVGGKFGTKENQLFINNGDNTFTEKATTYGLADIGNSVQATFFDYDRDGDLDMYLANYPPTPFNAPNSFYAFKKGSPKEIETDKLYRNDGKAFTDVSKEAGLASFGLTLSATVGDLNSDGWPDIYVSNDFSTPDYLFINNKNGTFSDQLKNLTKNTSFYGMGVDIADFNNDQLLDIMQVDMTPKDNRRAKANMASMNPDLFWSTVNAGFHYQYMQNSLQMNNGMLHDSLPDFSNVSRLAGISSTDWSWGPLIVDLDNDGWKDIYISNGTRREINNRDYFLALKNTKGPQGSTLERSLAIPSEKIDNFAFKNNGDLTFTEMNKAWGISYKGFSNGGLYVDLDNDGDLEIVTNNIDDEATVFENTSSTQNNHLTLKFQGTDKNPFGIGVKATINSGENKQYGELTLTRGFQSSVAPQMHFGLGKVNTVKTVFIEWPDGKTQLLNNITANQFLTLNYKDAVDSGQLRKDPPEKLFMTEKDSTIIVQHKHIENYYNDFMKEILLPHQTSTFGPSLAVGDLNGDQMEDFIIGGASQSEAGIYLQTKNGFTKQNIDPIARDKELEDMGILIFDADSDGDNDIYMVSGGNEFDYNSINLQDRFYINNGQGNFTKSSTALPPMITSGSRVHSFDYDKDGDLDLFVGGRLVPGNYPLPAKSYLLENISTKGNPKFTDATNKIAPSMEKLGMVTDASWTDYDNDGWTDLIVVGEWMPITVFKNIGGQFKNMTEQLDLDDTNGWWFSIKQGDFDKDGDMDLLVGNLGLNYKYKASKEETFDIYFNDFDNNNKNDIVLSYFNGGKKYPLRGRECSSQQMPGIKKKFKDYNSFSTATLEDVYTDEYLEKSLHYEIKSFASVYIENRDGAFILHQLPNIAQISSINQIIVQDFDGDSNLDAIIAGNLFRSEVETPRNDAGTGLFLKGDGKGNFEALSSSDTGFFAIGDVKDMVPIVIGGKEYILVGKNSDYLQFIELNNKEAKNSVIALRHPL